MNSNEIVRTIVKLGLTEQRGYIEDALYSNILREIEYIISAGKCADGDRLTASEGKFHNHHLVPIEERNIIYSEKEWGNTDKAYLTYYFGIQQPSLAIHNNTPSLILYWFRIALLLSTPYNTKAKTLIMRR